MKQFTRFLKVLFPGFVIIWILSLGFAWYSATPVPDELSGRVYQIQYKGRTLYFSLFDEVMVIGSTLGMVLSFCLGQFLSWFVRDNSGESNNDGAEN